MSDVDETKEVPWNYLPYTVLVSIFEYLGYHDRFKAGLMCRHWNFAFESPTLWKKMDFYFGIYAVHDSRMALQFMRKHASALKHLQLYFLSYQQSYHQDFTLNLHAILTYLTSCSQLHSLKIENFHQQRGLWPLLIKFVASQRQLKRVDIVHSRFSLDEGLQILADISNNNETLERLRMTYFFEENATVFENQSFQNSLKSLRCLKTLMLSYQCISSEILKLLCRNKLPHLEHFSVVCDSSESLLHTVPNNQWEVMKRTYPKIRITFEMVEVGTLQEFSRLLPPSSGVSHLTYRCGFSIPAEESLRRNGNSILQYIKDNFATHLSCINLDFGFVGISRLEISILDLLRSCKLLKEVSVKGVLPSVVATKVCEIALEKGSALGDINLVFYFKSIETFEEMRLLEDYSQNLKGRGKKFYFNLLASKLFS